MTDVVYTSSPERAESPMGNKPPEDDDNSKWFDFHQQAIQMRESQQKGPRGGYNGVGNSHAGSRLKKSSQSGQLHNGKSEYDDDDVQAVPEAGTGRPHVSYRNSVGHTARPSVARSMSYVVARNSILHRRTSNKSLTPGEEYMLAIVEEREARRIEALERAELAKQEREAMLLEQEVIREHRSMDRVRDVEIQRRMKARDAQIRRHQRMVEAQERRDRIQQERIARVEGEWKKRESRVGAAAPSAAFGAPATRADPYAIMVAREKYKTPYHRQLCSKQQEQQSKRKRQLDRLRHEQNVTSAEAHEEMETGAAFHDHDQPQEPEMDEDMHDHGEAVAEDDDVLEDEPLTDAAQQQQEEEQGGAGEEEEAAAVANGVAHGEEL